MPKAINYKANSVVYFSGDFDNRVFLLNTGNIALTSIDIETGTQATEYIKKGEFFGVKSALGKHPREETAMVLTDSIVYAFTNQEFEGFAEKNTRIILQMIKVFSRQLRTIHKKLASLSDSHEETNPEEGLFNVMNTFYNSGHYRAACEVGKRYKVIYPTGKYITQVEQVVSTTESEANSSPTQNHFANQEETGTVHNVQVSFKMANDLLGKGDFNGAYSQFHSIIESGETGEMLENAYIGAGIALYSQEEFVRCLQLLSTFITKNPKSLKIAEALMYIGLCYQKMGRPDKAISFYDKAVLLAGPLLAPKIKELQASCASQAGGE